MTEYVFHLIHNASSFKRECDADVVSEVKRGASAISAELLTVIVSVEKLSKNYNLNNIKGEDMITITHYYNMNGLMHEQLITTAGINIIGLWIIKFV